MKGSPCSVTHRYSTLGEEIFFNDMNKKVFTISVFIILILGGVFLYVALQKKTQPSNQSSNQNVVPAQKLSPGNDARIIGTVIDNITEYAPVDGPAYLNVRTDDGAQIRATYSPGEAECKNIEMVSTGFSVKVGARVEIYAKAISEEELFLCDSTAYFIKTLTTTDRQQNSANDQAQNAALALDVFAGGSISGSSFEVKISDDHITYQETTQGGAKEVNIERSLLPVELNDIRKTITEAGLISLQSQDFTLEPLVPDQASYRITISLDGKENKINCGIPPSGTEPTTACQKQIDKLRLKLNSMLGVNIY